MKAIMAIVFGIMWLGYDCSLASAGQQSRPASASGAESTPAPNDDFHFVSVLRRSGEVTAVDPSSLILTLKDAKGQASTIEVRRQEDLAKLKIGDEVEIQYFEGARIAKTKTQQEQAIPTLSLKDGILSANAGAPQKVLLTSVARVDVVNQEVTIKAADGTIDTIMVMNPEYMSHIKVGDQVVLEGVQALALNVKKQD